MVVDDHSTDGTAGVVEAWLPRLDNLRLVKNTADQPERRGKKAALTQGIATSTGEIIAVIDADCTAQPTWLSGLVRYFTPDTGIVAGATLFKAREEKTLLHKLQSLEVVTLIAAGAGSLGVGRPTICNGSNLAYRRTVFEQVNGFAGIEKVPSGDDDMFVQKVHQQTSWKVVFAADPGTFNWTTPVNRIWPLLRQRIRWSSTSAYYPDRILSAFLIMAYFYYWLSLASVGLIVWQPIAHLFLVFLLASKEVVQVLVLVKGCLLFKRTDLIKYLPLLILVHMPYLLFVSTLGVFKKITWKEG
jgi:cellulose synthase/poly-beta-1,6-N-acetylglucosamine synthase-like glycosyltransferase